MTHLRFQASQDGELRPIHGNAFQKRHGASSRTRRTLPIDRSPVQAGRRLSEPASGILGAHGPLVEPLFEQAAKCGIVLQESIDEIVILAERDELEGGCAVDRDNHRLVVAETPVTAQMRFGLTQRNDLHGAL